MAEIFALATGAISVAGFAGQLARSAAFLQDFIRDIRHAPDDVRKLGEELKALQAILDNIHTSNPTPHADLELALEQNATRLKELTDVANAAKSRLQGKKPALCSQFRVALGRSDVSKYLGELERSKSLLVQACLNASRNHETANSTLLRGLETSMTGLYSGQQAVNSIAANIRTVVDRIQTDSSSLMSTSTQVFELTTETHSNTSKLIHSTEQIHRSVEKLEATTHALIEKTLGQQSRLAEVMQGELNRKLSKTLKRHLRQHRRSQRDSPQGVGGSLHGGMNTAAEHNASQGPREGFHDPTTQATPLQNTGRFSQSAHRVNRWVKNSSTTTQYLNLIVGTIKILTSTTSYAQKSDEGSSVEQMQTSTTLVSFVPAPWLTRRGVVFQCKSTQFVSSTGQTCNPHWGLSAVKIIPYDSEIFEACWCFDLPTVRRLFDEGQASPYDVDKNGRSLLAWTVFAVQSLLPHAHHRYFRKRFDKLKALIDWFLQLGLDPGSMDLHGSTPVGLFYMLYHRSDGSSPKPHYDDEYRLLCQKLHKFARTDPFSVSHALVEVGPRSTGYRFTDFPGIQDSWTRQSLFPLSEIICLMKQGEWDFSWHESQLDDVCSLRWRPWDNRITVVRYHVFFWVTQTVHHIQKCLDAKMALLNVFLDFGALRLRPGDDHCVIKALRSTIFQGAETINLLMQSDYYGTGNPPWIRHRSRKVIMARKWLVDTFVVLLSYGSKYVADAAVLNDLSQHAQKQAGGHTFGAWMEAMQKVSRYCSNHAPTGGDMHTRGNKGTNQKTWKRLTDITNTRGGWEPKETHDEEGWETEEDWKQVCMLETAVDESDDGEDNPQIPADDQPTRPGHLFWEQKGCLYELAGGEEYRPPSHDFRNYDERYWGQFYPRLMGIDEVPASAPDESRIRQLAKITRDFLAFVV